MTIKEKLNLLDETEKKNESNIRKWKLMNAHKAFVRSGKYHEARQVLHLLRCKILRLGLEDDSCETEFTLDALGFRPQYSRNYNSATYRLY